MSDAQLYLAIGVPVFAIVLNMLAGMFQINSLNARFTSLEGNMNARFTSIENRFTSIENRFTSMDARFETLTGKVIEIDNRLIRLEAILERH
jgi:archaellum component FlaC